MPATHPEPLSPVSGESELRTTLRDAKTKPTSLDSVELLMADLPKVSAKELDAVRHLLGEELAKLLEGK